MVTMILIHRCHILITNDMNSILIILLILSGGLWIWALSNLIRSRNKSIKKALWLIAIFIFPIIGPIIYFQINNKPNINKRKNV